MTCYPMPDWPASDQSICAQHQEEWWPCKAVQAEEAEQEALHEVQCPSCGATIRARMADK